MHLKFQKISVLSSILIFSFILTSCFSIKQNFQKSAKRHYEAFYVGYEGTQYFIKPLKFKKPNGEELLLDITLRKKDKVTSSPILNFTILSNSYVRKIDKIQYINDDVSVKAKQIELLFNEKDGNEYVSRFSNSISSKNVAKLFGQENWKIKVYLNDTKIIYNASNRTSRIIEKLNQKLFLEK
jgi:hypothetical protein